MPAREPTSATDLRVRAALGEGIDRLTAAGIETARLDTQLLLANAMRVRREDLHRDPDARLDYRASLVFDKSIELRALRRPLAYITGEQWFYGRSFKINRAVLIPRPETEMLVDFAKAHAAATADIADICTGSGCIGVSIAAEMPEINMWMSDISHNALLIAGKNVIRHQVGERVTLAEGNLYEPLLGRSFDLIVANPPYITLAQRFDLMPEVRDYEPSLALWGEGSVKTGEDGTLIHQELLSGAGKALKPHGWIAMEVGAGQAQVVAQAAGDAGLVGVEILRDGAGIERIVAARRI